MMCSIKRAWLVALLYLAAGSVSADQIFSFNLDLDDNMIITDARIRVRHAVTGEIRGVSSRQWLRVRHELGLPGEWFGFEVYEQSFLDFSDNGPDGVDTYARQVEYALERYGAAALGPSFEAGAAALKNPRTRPWTSLITARQHAPSSILRMFDVLIRYGCLPPEARPEERRIFPVGWAGLDPRFHAPTTAGKKAKVQIFLLDEVEAVPVPEGARLLTSPDGDSQMAVHLWGFSDDDPENSAEAEKLLPALVAAGHWPHVKVLLFPTPWGEDSVECARAITSNGNLRKLRPEEGSFQRRPAA